MRFLGLELHNGVLDGTTMRRFRERLKEPELVKALIARFGDHLSQAGMEAHNGRIIDASIVLVRIERNSREENRGM